MPGGLGQTIQIGLQTRRLAEEIRLLAAHRLQRTDPLATDKSRQKYPLYNTVVLEIGACDGAVLECLRKNNFGREWHAFEISSSAVVLTNSKGFPSQVFDGGNLPQADKSFDVVILLHVVEHLEHPRMLLQEAGRVGARV
jgi:2-polyprenyl-3-methyl-5-hydroxy-6-metoxy-1,4-benzoquinol methylase